MMAKTSVVGVFKERDQAEKALEALKRAGFNDRDISVVGRRDEAREGDGARLGTGTAWGAGIGATAGLLATAGALTIPGIGPLVAVGPLAATLGGAATGGVAGALVDWGIPENRGRELEQRVKEGRYLAVVEADGKADRAREILQNQGANEVEKFAGDGARR